MKLGLSACKLRACFAALMVCMLFSSNAVLSKEATAIPAAPLKAAMDAVILLPQLSPQEKDLIEALPDIIASVVAKQEGVASDIVPESECNFAQAAGLLQSLDEKLLSLAQSTDPVMALHINALRKTINLIVDVVTLTQDPAMSDPTQVTRQTEALVDVVREKVNALMRQLLKMQSIIESASSSTSDIFGSFFPIIESNFDVIESELEIIESKADACCALINSKLNNIGSELEIINNNLSLSGIEGLESIIEACCALENSKLDVITSVVESLNCNNSAVISELDIIDSKADACCTAENSKLNIISSKLDIVINNELSISGIEGLESLIEACCQQSAIENLSSEVAAIDSKTDACCKQTQSKLDALNSKDDLLISLVEEIASDVDVILSKVDKIESTTTVIDSNVDIIESIVENLACVAPTPLPAAVGGVITITQSGSYGLCNSTTCAQIIVDASDVCIDLGCQTLSFTSSNGSIITINDTMSNVTIHNGTITGSCARAFASPENKRYDENGRLKSSVRSGVTSCGNDGITIGQDCSGILLKDLSISDVNCQAVHANVGCSDITVRDCDLGDTGESGILIEAESSNVMIDNVTIHDCGMNGIHFFTSNDLVVKNSVIQNVDPGNAVGGAAILLQGTMGTSTENCTVENVNTKQCAVGIKLDTVLNASILSSTLQDSVLYGIFSTQNSQNININSVFIDEVSANTSGDGIFVQNGASVWTISNTNIQGANSNGINLDGNGGTISDFTISNCTITGCQDNGMSILNCNTMCVKNSVFMGNGLNTSSAKGGIDISNGTSCSFSQCKVIGNTGNPAFGFSLEDSTLCAIIECLISNNSSTGASNGILIMGVSTNNDIRKNSVVKNTSGTNASVGINHQSGDSTNKFFGNYVCGHNTDFIGVNFLGTLSSASQYYNVSCSNTGTDQIQVIESKIDALGSLVVVLDEEINSKLDIILNGTC